ncbi:putative E3 ubiquitin-protein ligase HERC2 [Phytophthora citrophthora]|uniref:E3 ubiquitin-protein ligase HERC2 n=1 Tax=Phytophthora citrophthora TaxID=4793 RepID=A0AAD9LQ71_9STRA|nr:putative E3 ubiquitin-protein ligase HERC2 [Phytophthora citrophthora]
MHVLSIATVTSVEETRTEASTSEAMEAPVMVEQMRECSRNLSRILQNLHDVEFEEKDVDEFEEAQEKYEDTTRSDAEFADCLNEPLKFSILSPAPLPELLKVLEWGKHDDTDTLSPSSFRPLHIATVCTINIVIIGDDHANLLVFTQPLPRNRIVEAACSRFHTLFLNDMGLVFAYGHNLDGALGIGEEFSGYVAQPTLLEFFFDNLVVVQQISCGGDQLTGAHSAAVSQDGSLFTWGVGVALGTGTLRSALTPQHVELPHGETAQEDGSNTKFAVQSVSCGSGFCVAISREGHAFSWGKWADGRLGLGPIPVIAKTSRRHGGGTVRKQFQMFQLHPKPIQSLFHTELSTGGSEDVMFLKVDCGDAHCVGLTTEGKLFTWGRGSSGQQGRGDVSNTFAPAIVPKLTGTRWIDVAAGENWSMALSIDGKVWSWGGCGASVLGHGLQSSERNALLAQTVLQRYQQLLSQDKTASTTSLSSPKLQWMVPQSISCFSTPDIRICRLSAGAQHAAAISDTGDLYMWGDGYPEGSIGDVDTNHFVLSSLPKLVNSGQHVHGDTSTNNDTDIGTHSVEYVVCGGRQTIAFTSGSFLARSMSKLYRDSNEPGEGTSPTDSDLVLVVSGQRLQAHKLLLAQRSPVLRELILEEEQRHSEINSLSGTEPMELLLPRLRVDVARALLEYIYTDSFTLEVSKSSYFLLRDVLRAAKLYKLPSLIQLCRARLFSASPVSLFGVSSPPSALDDIAEDNPLDDIDSEDEPEENVGDHRTLNDDMKFALSDDVWADTVLQAEGRSILVHRCMLIARSEYFRALLAFNRSALHSEYGHLDKNMALVKVEDTYAGIVRVLRFIYYDQVTLPQLHSKVDDSEMEAESEQMNDQLLEDLVAADKYGLERMKRLCEHAIEVTEANCLDVLAVAELVHAVHLKQVALNFVQSHLAAVTAREDEFLRFQQSFPRVLEELYISLRESNQEETLLREWYTDVKKCLDAQREERETQWSKKSAAAAFPWVPLSLTIVFGTLYLSVMHTQEHEYSAVPATNLVAIAAIVVVLFMGYL